MIIDQGAAHGIFLSSFLSNCHPYQCPCLANPAFSEIRILILTLYYKGALHGQTSGRRLASGNYRALYRFLRVLIGISYDLKTRCIRKAFLDGIRAGNAVRLQLGDKLTHHSGRFHLHIRLENRTGLLVLGLFQKLFRAESDFEIRFGWIAYSLMHYSG